LCRKDDPVRTRAIDQLLQRGRLQPTDEFDYNDVIVLLQKPDVILPLGGIEASFAYRRPAAPAAR
jgi:hypothetical protein